MPSAQGGDGQDQQAVAERLVGLEEQEWVVLDVSDHGKAEAYVEEVETDHDGLTATAVHQVMLTTKDGRTYRTQVAVDQHAETPQLAYATVDGANGQRQFVDIEAVRESDQQQLVPDGGQDRPRPAAWPESFSMAGEDPSCPHQLTWDDGEGVYVCIYGCGRRAEEPPGALVDGVDGRE